MKSDKENNFIGLKLLSAFSIGCIGSGQMFLPIFYKKVLGLGNDKIGFIFSISKKKKGLNQNNLPDIFFKLFSAFCILHCISILDFLGR